MSVLSGRATTPKASTIISVSAPLEDNEIVQQIVSLILRVSRHLIAYAVFPSLSSFHTTSSSSVLYFIPYHQIFTPKFYPFQLLIYSTLNFWLCSIPLLFYPDSSTSVIRGQTARSLSGNWRSTEKKSGEQSWDAPLSLPFL